MSRRILAVDDDADIAELIQVILDQAGYVVETAGNGASALQKMESTTPDLVILDVMMPDMSGLSVLRAMRAQPETAATPVVILTARTTETDIADAYGLGADIFLCKPFEPEELLQLVERFLAPQSPALTSATV